MKNSILVKNAREHNLKGFDVEIPRDRLVVLTGLSGSGKSSLAFDTIYAEGQRRFLESLSAYAKKHVSQLKKPEVDLILGLSPVISIEQKSISKNPRSTVGTMTDIYDYLRILYATSGCAHCPRCRREIPIKSVEQIVEHLLSLPPGTPVEIDARSRTASRSARASSGSGSGTGRSAALGVGGWGLGPIGPSRLIGLIRPEPPTPNPQPPTPHP